MVDFSQDTQTNPLDTRRNTGGISGAGQQEVDFSDVNTMGQLLERYNDSFAPLGVDASFPNRNTGVQIGTYSGSEVGNVPIFSAGAGLFPFNILDARNQAKQLALQKQQEELLNAIDFEYVKTKDAALNVGFAKAQLAGYQEFVKPYVEKFGAKGYVLARKDPMFKMMILKNEEARNNFDTFFDAKVKILDAMKRNEYVPDDVRKMLEYGERLYSNEKITTDDLFRFNADVLKSYTGLVAATEPYVKVLNETLNQYIDTETIKRTNIEQIFREVETKGVTALGEGLPQKLSDIADIILNTTYAYASEKPLKEDIVKTLESKLISYYKETASSIKRNDAIDVEKAKKDLEKVNANLVQSSNDLNIGGKTYTEVRGRWYTPRTSKNEPVIGTMNIDGKATKVLIQNVGVIDNAEMQKPENRDIFTRTSNVVAQYTPVSIDVVDGKMVMTKLGKPNVVPYSELADDIESQGVYVNMPNYETKISKKAKTQQTTKPKTKTSGEFDNL